MAKISPRSALAPLALLGLGVGTYFFLLRGVVPVPHGADVTLLALAGVLTVGAAVIRAKMPTVTAGVATLGFALGFTSDPLVVNVAAVLTVLGGLGFLISTTHYAFRRGTTTNPVVPNS